jgi:3'(2'), 5'-bisphosphate nucleotidase
MNMTLECLKIARDAGAAIMDIYSRDFSVDLKADQSPLTAADIASHHIIEAGLNALDASIPVLSEESAHIDWAVRRTWSRYWLVDPLDGTREFIKKNGEFTVNIALIEHGNPVFGVIYAPVLKTLWWGDHQHGAFKQVDDQPALKIDTEKTISNPLRVAASRSHLDELTRAALTRMGNIEASSMGSSLKFCSVADNRLDVYPRFAPTSEWDTAAGQAIVEAAGGCMLHLDGSKFQYNCKASLLNPHFIVLANTHLPWRSWLHD